LDNFVAIIVSAIDVITLDDIPIYFFIVICIEKCVPFRNSLHTMGAPIDMEEIDGYDGFVVVGIGHIGVIAIFLHFYIIGLVCKSGHYDENEYE
jgi:hypothetical protein